MLQAARPEAKARAEMQRLAPGTHRVQPEAEARVTMRRRPALEAVRGRPEPCPEEAGILQLAQEVQAAPSGRQAEAAAAQREREPRRRARAVRLEPLSREVVQPPGAVPPQREISRAAVLQAA